MKNRNQNLFRIAVLGSILALLHLSVNAAVGEKLTPEEGNLKNVSAVQQQKSVAEKVTDSSGSSLPGVSVVVKGTATGTITDGNGNYSLSNVPENATLKFSFVGMKGQEIAVAGKSVVNVRLEDETIGLEEVVAVGYGTVRKSDLTGSVSKVGADEIQKSSSVSMETALQGRAAGVLVTQASSAPGGGISVRIRGGNSIQGGNEPLYVIDGVHVYSNNNEVNPGGGQFNEMRTAPNKVSKSIED